MCEISVVIPCYNAGKYLNQAISSVQRQTFSNWEIIIVDDGSNDLFTLNYLNELSKKRDTKISIFYQKNHGTAHARNTAIGYAKGTYILPLDADDIIEPTYMEKAINVFERHKNIGIVYCRAKKFGIECGEWKLPDFSEKIMTIQNVIFCSAFFYKSDWQKVGGYPLYAKHGLEDYAFWLRILNLGRDVYRINEILFSYRILPKSRTINFEKFSKEKIDTYAAIFRDNIDFFYKNAEGMYSFILNKKCHNKFIFIFKNFIRNYPLLYYLLFKVWISFKLIFDKIKSH